MSGDVERLQRENDYLRALVGNSDKACTYCGLGSEDQGKCASGFPGCARGDDQMLCREVGVGLERDELRRDMDIIREWYGAESIDGLLAQKRRTSSAGPAP